MKQVKNVLKTHFWLPGFLGGGGAFLLPPRWRQQQPASPGTSVRGNTLSNSPDFKCIQLEYIAYFGLYGQVRLPINRYYTDGRTDGQTVRYVRDDLIAWSHLNFSLIVDTTTTTNNNTSAGNDQILTRTSIHIVFTPDF